MLRRLSQTFRDSLWVPSSRFKKSKKNDVLTVEGWTYKFSEATVTKYKYLTFVCPCIANIILNDDQQDATIFGLLIYS